MITQKFSISGMTCQKCVEKITSSLKGIAGVTSVTVQLAEGTVTLEATTDLELTTVQESLAVYEKYVVTNFTGLVSDPEVQTNTSKFIIYKPLIIIFFYVILVSTSFQIYHGSFQPHLFMNHLMGGFFIGLSFFKILSLKAFADSFSTYDPVAKRITGYGLGYPFIELALGLLFIANLYLLIANVITVVILSVTTIGVLKRLQSKNQIQCACLGTAFNLPLSYVTVFENAVMILMAATSALMR